MSQRRTFLAIGRALLSVLGGDLELVSYRARKKHFHHTSGWGLLPVAEQCGGEGHLHSVSPCSAPALGQCFPGVFRPARQAHLPADRWQLYGVRPLGLRTLGLERRNGSASFQQTGDLPILHLVPFLPHLPLQHGRRWQRKNNRGLRNQAELGFRLVALRPQANNSQSPAFPRLQGRLPDQPGFLRASKRLERGVERDSGATSRPRERAEWGRSAVIAWVGSRERRGLSSYSHPH